jgi:decaprenylphospho-beta-D-ribofuranose 2-oxidase
MTQFISRELAGWGRFPTQECLVTRPEKRREVSAAVQSDEVQTVLARGLGRSYGDAALNEGSGVVLLEKLSRFLSFDAATGTLHAEGGVTFQEILETFVPRGWFLPVAPGTKNITLGGAIACDVHGKNHHRAGCISNYIDEFELLNASGETLLCSRTQNPEAFWATVAGMGLTGVILTAKLRLMPIETSQIYSTIKRTANLDETLEAFQREGEVDYESFAWIDCVAPGASLGRSVINTGNHATKAQMLGEAKLEFEPKKKKGVPVDFPNFALNPLSIKAYNATYYASHPSSESIVHLQEFFWPLDSIRDWNRIYGTRGFVQYQCVLPLDAARNALVKVLETIRSSEQVPFLAVLKVLGANNEAPLSFPFPGYSLALDFPNTPGIVEFCHGLDALTLEYGGRCYLAKDSTLQPATVRAMYPRLGEWEAVKRELDPHNRFQSSLSRRLQIGGAV